MSFADELRKEPAAPAYRLDKQRLDACVRGIKDACMKNRTTGSLKGYLCVYNDDGYGLECSVAPDLGKRLTEKDVNEHYKSKFVYTPTTGSSTGIYGIHSGLIFGNDPVFEGALRQEIGKLGFSSFTVKTVPVEEERRTIWAGMLGRYHVKYEKTGRTLYALYVDIRW